MLCVANVVVLLDIAVIASGLVIKGPDEEPALLKHANADVHGVTKHADREPLSFAGAGNYSHDTSSNYSHDTSYYTCAGSSCNVNTTKMKAELQLGLILFLGCSLDIYAIKHFCTSAHANLVGFENNFAYLAYCTMAGFTLVYVFQPGATAPPYWKDYVGTQTSQQIITQTAKDVVNMFGREPTAIVVDASLWDVSNWWQKHGMPPEPYPVPRADIARWCHTDLSQLLSQVETAFPRTKIAFRTPPPVFTGNSYGQSPDIVNEMVKCIRDDAVDF